MTDPVEEIVAPAAIERALAVYQQFKSRHRSVLVQARKILTRHIFGMVDRGEQDEQRLTVGGLSQLKKIERDHDIKSAEDIAPHKLRVAGVVQRRDYIDCPWRARGDTFKNWALMSLLCC